MSLSLNSSWGEVEVGEPRELTKGLERSERVEAIMAEVKDCYGGRQRGQRFQCIVGKSQLTKRGGFGK